MTTPLNVAVIGTGFGQKVHLPGFQHHPRTKAIALYNRDLDKARAIAAEAGVPHVANELDALLALPDVEAVSLATPPFLHYEMAKQAIASDKHLLLEKPLNLNAGETRDLYRMATERGLVTAVDFEFRFVPAWQRLAEYLADGYVGQKRLVKIDWLVASRANPSRGWNWYAQKDKGGGALGAVGSHSFDYIHWLFGGVRRLCARLSTAIAQRPDESEGGIFKPVDADDTCLLMLELADGTPCQLTISSVAYGGRGHWLEVYGDRGTLVLGSSNLKDYVHGFHLYAAPAGQALTEVEIPKRLAFEQVFSDGRLAPFIRVVDGWVEAIGNASARSAIATGGEMVPGWREGVYSQLLMDLTHQSHQENRWLEVPDLDEFLAG